jgi:hypothetical protein
MVHFLFFLVLLGVLNEPDTLSAETEAHIGSMVDPGG